MYKYIAIGLGGVVGAVLRCLLRGVNLFDYHGVFPINTLAINVAGSFLLAMILTFALNVLDFNEDLRLGLTTGFLGAFTTFSTFCKEGVGLLNGAHYVSFGAYLLLSVALGLGAVALGSRLITRNAGALSQRLGREPEGS